MSNPVSIERVIRSRFLRVAASLFLIGLSGWAFLPYVIYRVASSAFVNAELIRVTAPITGQLTPDLPHKGAFIDRAATVSLIQSLSPDRRHLLALDQDLAVARERVGLARAQLEDIATMDRELARRMEAYRAAMTERIGHEIEETEAERSGCLAEARMRRDAGTRLEELVKLGLAPSIRSTETFASREATSTRCKMAQARLERLGVERAAAQKGVFLRDGENDVPYSQQQRDRLVLRRQELQAEILQETARSTQLATEIAEERHRVEHASQYDLRLPASHVVWSVAASPGSAVTEGQTILDLADCRRRFVVVDLPERDFEAVKAGDAAAIRLVGGSDWLAGRVQQVRGSAARSDERLLAAQVLGPNPGNISVDISIPPDAQPANHNNFCDIGRLAEVRFQRSGLSLADKLGSRLQQFLDGAWARVREASALASR